MKHLEAAHHDDQAAIPSDLEESVNPIVLDNLVAAFALYFMTATAAAAAFVIEMAAAFKRPD